MKDQLALLRKCIVNDIPAIVFQGDDSCTVEVLEAAIEIYRRHGASREFLYDFQNVIDDVKAYQIQNPHRTDRYQRASASAPHNGWPRSLRAYPYI